MQAHQRPRLELMLPKSRAWESHEWFKTSSLPSTSVCNARPKGRIVKPAASVNEVDLTTRELGSD